MRILLTFLALAALSLQGFAQQGNWTTYLKASRAGRPLQEAQTLWVPTDAGLLEVNLESNTANLWNKTSAGLSSNSIEAVARDPVNGDFFIGTYDVAMMRRSEGGGGWEELPYPEQWVNDNFNPLLTYCAAVDDSGILWTGTSQGLFRYDGQEWSRFGQSNGHPFLGAVWDIQPAPDGGMYLASHQLLHIKDGVVSSASPEQIGNHFLFAYGDAKMNIQADSSLWFFPDIGLVGHYDGQQWEVFDSIGGQPVFQSPSFVGETPEGNLLIYYPGTGFVQFTEGQWAPYSLEAGDSLLQLHFLEDGWVAVYPETVAIHSGSNTLEISYTSFPFQSVPYYLRYGGNGQLWVKDGYNSLLNLDSWERFDAEGEEAPDYIFDYAFAPSGTLWAVSGSAVHRYAQGNWERFGPDNAGLPATNGYLKIVSDGGEGVWLDVSYEGLFRFENGEWKKQQHPAFELNYIVDMEAGAGGELWLHLYESGPGSRLARWAGGQLHVFTDGEAGYQAGLTEALFFEQETGRFWTAGAAGLQYFDGQSWQQIPLAPGFEAPTYVRSLLVRGETMVVVSTSGLYLHKDGQWSLLNSENTPLANEHIFEAGLGQDGVIWALRLGYPVVDRYDWGVVTQDNDRGKQGPFEDLRLYPNPARDVLWLEIKGEAQEAEILLFDLRGQLLKAEKTDAFSAGGALAYPASGLNSGWYRLMVKTGDKAYSASFLKQ